MKTFGKLYLRVEKMAGLRVEVEENPKAFPKEPLHLRGWDQERVPELSGILRANEEILWDGIIYTRAEIEGIFRVGSLADPSYPRTYASRNGSLNRRATVGVIRLATEDGQVFSLQKCNAGEELESVLATTSGRARIELEVSNGSSRLRHTLFDEADGQHQKRLLKAQTGIVRE